MIGKLHEKENENENESRKEKKKTNLSMLTGLLHYCILLSKEFLLFSTMPISIETVVLIRTTIAVCLIIPFAVHVFEDMRTRLAFFGGYSICFLVIHATSCFLSVMFSDVCPIAFSTPGGMRATTKC